MRTGNVWLETTGPRAVVRLTGSAFAAVLTKAQCRRLAAALLKFADAKKGAK